MPNVRERFPVAKILCAGLGVFLYIALASADITCPNYNSVTGNASSPNNVGVSWSFSTGCSVSSSQTFANSSGTWKFSNDCALDTSVVVYGQCGGSGWQGTTLCAPGSRCQYQTELYSQCIPQYSCALTNSPCNGSGMSNDCCDSSQYCGNGKCITNPCIGKSCGNDGYGGSCGTCTGGYTCNTSGQCVSSGGETEPDPECQVAYGQCGGIGYSGKTRCCSGHECVYITDYYMQCVPGGSSCAGLGAYCGSYSPTGASCCTGTCTYKASVGSICQ